MKVFVACEFSGIVRRAFAERGHTAWSIDLLPTELPCEYGGEGHFEADIFDFLKGMRWIHKMDPDLLIAFPPCTHLCVSGARWWKDKRAEQSAALDFVEKLMHADIPRIAIENPIGKISTSIRQPDQIIQPWQFGHGETKATCLWLKNLPKLQVTDVVAGRRPAVWKSPDSKGRWKKRSLTYVGIANAMADQWGML